MTRTHRIALLTALAAGVCAPNALAAPTATLETSAKRVFNQPYYQTPAGTKVFFNAAHSKAGVPFGQITKVEMDLNGNGVYDYTSTNPIPSGAWTFQAPARDLTIKLRVTNSFGQTDEDSLRLHVNTPPQAVVSVPDQPVTVNTPVLIDAASSTDDEAGLSYAFDPEGDGTFTAYQPTPTYAHTYAQPGGYAVRTKVMDRYGLESLSGVRGLQVNPAPVATPTPAPTSTPAPDTTPAEASILTTRSQLTRKRFAFTVGCPATESRCTGELALAPKGRAAFTPARFDLAGGATQALVIRANRAAVKRVKRRGALRTIATTTATDAAGNTGIVTARVKLVR